MGIKKNFFCVGAWAYLLLSLHVSGLIDMQVEMEYKSLESKY